MERAESNGNLFFFYQKIETEEWYEVATERKREREEKRACVERERSE